MRNNIKLTMDLVIKLCVLTIVSKVYGMDPLGQYITFLVTTCNQYWFNHALFVHVIDHL